MPSLDDKVGRAQLRDGFAAGIPLGRLRLPQKVAAAAAFLASDQRSFTTGRGTICRRRTGTNVSRRRAARNIYVAHRARLTMAAGTPKTALRRRH